MSPCPALHQPPAVTPLFCSKCPLTPDIQGVAALGHQFLDIVHSLLLVHLAIFSYNLVKDILHIPSHVACITGRKKKRVKSDSEEQWLELKVEKKLNKQVWRNGMLLISEDSGADRNSASTLWRKTGSKDGH